MPPRQAPPPPSPSLVERFPVEVWDHIFQLAINLGPLQSSYCHQVDDYVRDEESSSSFALDEVARSCKLFETIALPYLYRDVSSTSLERFSLCLRTVREDTSSPTSKGIGRLVKELYINVDAWNLPPDLELMYLPALIALLPNLRHVEFTGMTSSFALFPLLHLLDTPSSLTSLVNITVSASSLLSIVGALPLLAPHLRKLDLQIQPFHQTPLINSLPSITFPSLHTLGIFLPNAVYPAKILQFMDKSILPSLTRLDLDIAQVSAVGVELEPFLAAKGKRVTDFSLPHHWALPSFLKHFPILTSLRCEPFKMEHVDPVVASTFSRLESLIVTEVEWEDNEADGAPYAPTFFKFARRKNMPRLKEVVWETGSGSPRPWRTVMTWGAALSAEGVAFRFV